MPNSGAKMLRGTQELPEDGNKLPKHVGAQGWMCDQKELIRCICRFFYEYTFTHVQSSQIMITHVP
jgi:hypothetical protein